MTTPTPLGGEILVNTATVGGTQFGPVIAALPGGGYVVVFNDPTTNRLLLQRFDNGGSPVGSEVTVTTVIPPTNPAHSASIQSFTVAADTAGNLIVAWTFALSDGSTDRDVRARTFDSNGVGGSELILGNDGNDELPSVAYMSDGKFVLAWGDRYVQGTAYAQIHNADGTTASSPIVVDTGDTSVNPALDTFDNNNFVLVYEDVATTIGVVYNSSGSFVVPAFAIANSASNVNVKVLESQKFIVTWNEIGANSQDIHYRIYNQDGSTFLGDTIANSTLANDQTNSTIIALSDGGFVLAWNSAAQDSDVLGVYGQRFDATGVKVGSEFLVNQTTSGNQSGQIPTGQFGAELSNGDIVFGWGGNGTGDGEGAFTRVFDVPGNGSDPNDAPVNTLPATFTTDEDSAVTLSGLSVADPDAGTGTITVTLSVPAGTLTATAGGGVAVGGGGTASLTLTGTLANINTFLSGSAPSFTPAANANGSVTLTMTTDDGGNTGSGGALTDTDTRTITVNAVNDAPTGAPTATLAAGTEDTAYTVNATDLLAGFTDTENNTLSVTGLSASNGSVADNGNGTFTVSPTGNFNGTMTLTYTVSDGNGGTLAGQTRTFAVAAVNDAPTGAPTASLAAGTEDTAYTVSAATLLQGFSDAENNTLSVTAISASNGSVASNGDGTFTITPTANFNGTMTLTYTVSDGNGGTLAGQTRTFAVNSVNDAPTGTPTASLAAGTEDTAYVVSAATLLQGFSDAENNTLSVTGLTASNGSVASNGDGTFTITPTANFNETMTLTYTVSDGNGGTLAGQTRTFAVAAVNDAPTTGDDVFVSGAGNETISGGRGMDTYDLRLSGVTAGVAVDLAAGTASGAGIGTDRLSGIENVTGGSGNDTITGSGATNQLDGAGGDDSIMGGAGRDDLIGGEGKDTLSGGSGNDSADGGEGDDLIMGDSGNDLLAGDGGKDTIDGGSGRDSIAGGGDDDNLIGGTGNDSLDGGLGADSLDGGAGDDVLTIDTEDLSVLGGAGRDTVVVDLNETEGVTLNLAASSIEIAVGGSGGDTFDGTGSTGAVTLSGGAGNDTLLGGSRNDRIDGGDGADELNGGLGSDVLLGGDGVDLINGGGGNDRLSGGGLDADLDTFHFGAGWGRDSITDFEQGVDKIEIDGVTGIGQLTITTRGTVTTIKVTGDNANTITVNHTPAGAIEATDFDFVP